MYQKRRLLDYCIVLCVDSIATVISIFLAYFVRYGIADGMVKIREQIWYVAFLLLAEIVVDTCLSIGAKFFRRGYFEELRSLFVQKVVVFGMITMGLYFVRRSADISRLMVGYYFVFSSIICYVFRVVLRKVLIGYFRNSRYSSKMIIVSNSKQFPAVLENILGYNEWHREIVGVVFTDTEELKYVDKYPVVGNRNNLVDIIIHSRVDEVFFIDNTLVGAPLLKMWVHEIGKTGVIINVNIDAFDLKSTGKKTLGRVGKYAVVTFARNIYSMRQMALKRLLDIVGASVGMVLLGIATIIVGPLIKLDSPGPIFFGQKRVGKNGRIFTFYKFRSMYQDAEARKKELLEKNEMSGLMFKMEDDPRITRIGKFLRKTSIDELPQFYNVLRGDMSLVGTRPPTVDEFEQYEAKHKSRLSMIPGITGMWQVSGRSDIQDFEEVVRLDLEYIDNWTIWKDIKILLQTVKVVVLGKGSR